MDIVGFVNNAHVAQARAAVFSFMRISFVELKIAVELDNRAEQRDAQAAERERV
jgi:hypothetical protein